MAYSPIVTATWTPNLQINGSNTGITYTTQAGGYTQIGNVVYIWGQIVLSSKGVGAGAVTISNLPVATSTNGNRNTIGVNWFNGYTAAGYTTLCLQLAASSTVASLFMSSASGSANAAAADTNITNTTQLRFSGLYILD